MRTILCLSITKPSPDFARAILPYAKNIEVQEPIVLRKMVIGMALDILKNYKREDNG